MSVIVRAKPTKTVLIDQSATKKKLVEKGVIKNCESKRQTVGKGRHMAYTLNQDFLFKVARKLHLAGAPGFVAALAGCGSAQIVPPATILPKCELF